MKRIRIGLVGTGGMGQNHAMNFSAMKGVDLVACCDTDIARARWTAKEHGIGNTYADFAEMLEHETLDAITNVTPDKAHAPIAMQAAKAGVHVLSEKPLASTYEEGRRMLRTARRCGIMHMVHFNYRNSDAIQEAAALIRKGKLGRIMHVETSYLQSWLSTKIWGDWRTNPHWLWRLSTAHGSTGVLGDIGCHLYDATAFLVGDFESIQCRLKTFDKGARRHRVGKYRLDANDSFISTVMFRGGAMGTIHSTRWATGQANSLRFRVYGDAGAVEIDLDRSYEEYRICAGTRDPDRAVWRTVKAKPKPDIMHRFVRAIRTGKQDICDFENALKVQAYMHYSVESDRTGRPVRLPADPMRPRRV